MGNDKKALVDEERKRTGISQEITSNDPIPILKAAQRIRDANQTRAHNRRFQRRQQQAQTQSIPHISVSIHLSNYLFIRPYT